MKIDEYNARKSHWEEVEVEGGVDEEWPLDNGRWPLASEWQPVVDRSEGMADGRRG